MKPKLIVDIGNSTVSIARFSDQAGPGLPSPSHVWHRPSNDLSWNELPSWLPVDSSEWVIGSVHRSMRESLQKWIATQRPADTHRLLSHQDFSIDLQVDRPERVGIDRLAAAFAANSIRDPESGAIVIDTGSATTVDLISPTGAFLGGSIFPGLQLSLRSLAEHTDQLPSLQARTEVVPLYGKNTEQAMWAGVYWSAVEGLRGIVAQLRSGCDYPCQVFGTGGDMAGFLPHLGGDIEHVTHLVSSGMWLATRDSCQERPG